MTSFVNDPDGPVDPQTIVDAAINHPAEFSPGQGWSYSNTNYTIAGMVIEAVVAGAAGATIRDRVLGDGFTATALDGDEPLPGELAQGFGPAGGDLTHALHPSVPWTAGSMVATIGDLVAWGEALYGGAVLTAAEKAGMLETVPVQNGVRYGLGLLSYDASLIGGISPAIGHNGGIPGYSADLLYLTELEVVVAAVVNHYQAQTSPYVAAALDVLYPDS